MKIATILDTFSYKVFEPEANLYQLTPANWTKELESFKPDMLFVESAWRGKDDLWKDIISSCPQALIDIVEYCKIHNIPTVFWNKEDPYHFEDFIESAKLFEYVFTTDIECITVYRERLGHDNVYLLPFACQPKIHNPIEKYERKDGFVFAGAYYERFKERNEWFAMAIDTITSAQYNIDIYDRNYGKTTIFKYPKKFKQYIRGGLDYQDIDKAYKGYKYAINLNSMTTSPTMFSRRVFELMASNTIVISNYTVGQDMLLGELGLNIDEPIELLRQIREIENDALYEKKLKLAALRKVMLEHTAENRIQKIYSIVFKNQRIPDNTHIICISRVDKNNFNIVIKNFLKQSYTNKQLILYGKDIPLYCIETDDNISLIDEDKHRNYEYRHDKDIYVSGMSPNDYYGENYLLDLFLATKYTDSDIITKSGIYECGNKNTPVISNNISRYRFTDSSPIRSSIFKLSSGTKLEIGEFARSVETAYFKEKTVFAIDEFNYCKNISICTDDNIDIAKVADLKNIDTGITIDDRWISKQIRVHQQKIEERDGNLLSFQYKILQKELYLLTTISILYHPIKKYRQYKKLLQTYFTLRDQKDA